MEEVRIVWEEIVKILPEILPAMSQFLFFFIVSCISIVRQRKRYEKIIEGMRVDFNKKLLDADLKMRIKYGQKREEGND